MVKTNKMLMLKVIVTQQYTYVIMSPPLGLGDIMFLPWSSVRPSVRLSVCLLQNCVCSVAQKPFEIFS